MAFSEIKDYFRARIDAVDGNFKEWKDGFNFDNIPSNIYNKAYHLSYGGITGDVLGAEHQGVFVEFIVRFFFKGYRDVATNLDNGMDLCESVIKEVQEADSRLGLSIKNVKFLSMSVDPSFASNDNLILVTQTYLVTKYFCLGGS